MKKIIIRVAAVIVVGVSILVSFNIEKNYDDAYNAAVNSEGTDAAIEEAMSMYGFDIDAMDMHEPTFSTKTVAFFTAISNGQ